MNIYVGNLNYDATEDDVLSIFEEYGQVDTVKIIRDRATGRARGFGFVEMQDDESAKKAIEELNQTELMGRKIVVNEARSSRNT